MPEIIVSFFQKHAEYLLDLFLMILFSAAIFAAFFLFRKKISELSIRLVKKFLKRFPLAISIAEGFQKPLSALMVCIGVYWACTRIGKFFWPETTAYFSFLNAGIRISIIIAITWGLFAAAKPVTLTLLGDREEHDKTLLLFFSKIIQGVLLIISGAIIIRETGYDITGVVTGIGLGGLTFALAAQDSASNLFGGMVIIFDKPFAVDDWIETPDLEGIVTDITLRSTRIRTFKDAEIIIPNSTLANVSIINWSRMSKRRVHFTVGLTYQTPQEKLVEAVKAIRKILASHPDEVVQGSSLVTFDSFGAYSLNIEVYYFTSGTSWTVYMQTKEQINLEIQSRLAEIGVEFAYPTQTIFQEKQD